MKLEDGVEELKEHYMELKEVLQVIREEFSSQLNIRGIRWLEPDDIP
ncbi:MAG: hypothetical protein JJE15_12230 [Desulfobacteraceae bacterium]|nr:hypothetical protein [Desulfobacteraceae bacterium]